MALIFKKKSSPGALSLREAISLGEYRPEFLAKFTEWENLSVPVQFEFIRQALENRHKQLITYYAQLNNVLNLSKKPEVQEAMKKIETALKNYEKDREQLYVEYADKI